MERGLLAALDQFGELLEGIEGAGVQLGVVDADAEVVFDEKAQVDQAEGIDQAAGDDRFVRANDALGLFENITGDIGSEFVDDFFHVSSFWNGLSRNGFSCGAIITRIFHYQ